jgi:AAA ATPase domain
MVRMSISVPEPVDSFIGRAEELQTVKTLLAKHRFVTLTGAAGVGKTRLALRIAQEVAASDRWLPEHCCWCGITVTTWWKGVGRWHRHCSWPVPR